MDGPFALYRIATLPEAILVIIFVMKNGEIPFGPFVEQLSDLFYKGVHTAHTGPDINPQALGFTFPSMPLSRIACAEAAMAYWVNRSNLRTCAFSIY